MARRHRTLTEYVTESLREKILNGEFEGGEPLRQEALAELFEVSRIPVREALLQLEAQGYVQFVPHKGAVVTELSAERVEELFELRARLESQLLGRAIPNMTESDFQLAMDNLTLLDQALNQENSARWSELNYDFHSGLYLPADQPYTLDVVTSLHHYSDRYIRLQLSLSGAIPKAHEEHHTLLEYCRDRDVDAASDLLTSHILQAGEMIQKLLVRSTL